MSLLVPPRLELLSEFPPSLHLPPPLSKPSCLPAHIHSSQLCLGVRIPHLRPKPQSPRLHPGPPPIGFDLAQCSLSSTPSFTGLPHSPSTPWSGITLVPPALQLHWTPPSLRLQHCSLSTVVFHVSASLPRAVSSTLALRTCGVSVSPQLCVGLHHNQLCRRRSHPWSLPPGVHPMAPPSCDSPLDPPCLATPNLHSHMDWVACFLFV